MRRRKEFSQNVRTVDVLPVIQKKREHDKERDQHQHLMEAVYLNQIRNQHFQHRFIPHEPLPPPSKQELEDSENFDKFMENRKNQYISIGRVNRDSYDHDQDTINSGKTFSTSLSKSTSIYTNDTEQPNRVLYIPKKGNKPDTR